METGSSCLIGSGCAEFGNMGMGMLILSLGITIALVGALFYYVRQRFEVLEVSHKEQIGVMQNFIASIGDQFHRMHSFIQEQGSIMFAGGAKEVPAAGGVTAPTPLAPFSGGSLIDVSSDDDDSDYSDYDDDSATSDTDAADYGGSIKIHHDTYIDGARSRAGVADADDNATDSGYHDRDQASDIKIIELSAAPRNRASTNDVAIDTGDDDDDDDEDDCDDDDDDDEDDDEDDCDDDDDDSTDDHIDKVMNVTVIKSDGPYCEILCDSLEPEQQDASHAEAAVAGASRSMVIDLDLGELEVIGVSNSFSSSSPIPDAVADDVFIGDAMPASATGETGETDKNNGGGASYAQMSIKQLRKLVKLHNIGIHNHNQDISKLKREQLLEILAAANVKT